MLTDFLLFGSLFLNLLGLGIIYYFIKAKLNQQLKQNQDILNVQLTQFYEKNLNLHSEYKHQVTGSLAQTSISFEQRFHAMTQSLQTTQKQVSTEQNVHIEKLTQSVNDKLMEITHHVNQRLNDGFEKTSQTFSDIVKRLALIDNAQKALSKLSSDVVSLQDILNDKRTRGAFGEIQLNNLLANMLPTQHYALQHTLSSGQRVDCMLFLPDPTGNIGIDAKFPLENYKKMTSLELTILEKDKAKQQFKQDIKKHINDIADKYILPSETSDGAVMFIPAESIFADIHNLFPEIISYAQQRHVWLTSPTTMMAILTTAQAVLKHSATKEHIHIIQEHLRSLAKDFGRFEIRMNKLSQHIHQAHEDVQQVSTSAKKITSRFKKIEQAEIHITSEEDPALLFNE